MKKILVCLDGSKFAEQIMPYVLKQATALNSKVILLQVLSIPGIQAPAIPGFPAVPMRSSSMLEQLQKDKDKAQDYLENLAQPLSKKGIHVESITLEGSPGPAIINYANEHKVDLIAIATHGRSGLRHALFGSVAEIIVRESGLPILLIRPKNSQG